MFAANRSLVFLHELVEDIQKFFADQWILRIYHDQRAVDTALVDTFQTRYSFVDFCNVTRLNVSFIPPKIWRFLPACDRTVSVMASRDLDSPLTRRERAAIDEWLSSNLSFHSMRDHPYHFVRESFPIERLSISLCTFRLPSWVECGHSAWRTIDPSR